MKGLRSRVAYSRKQKILSENTITCACSQSAHRAAGVARSGSKPSSKCKLLYEQPHAVHLLSSCAV